jgi:hypothetical protein
LTITKPVCIGTLNIYGAADRFGFENQQGEAVAIPIYVLHQLVRMALDAQPLDGPHLSAGFFQGFADVGFGSTFTRSLCPPGRHPRSVSAKSVKRIFARMGSKTTVKHFSAN